MNYLLDTNIISEIKKPNPHRGMIQWLENVPNNAIYVSVLTLGELRKGIEKLVNGVKKNQLCLWLEHDLREWLNNRVLSINLEIAERWGYLQAEMNRPLPVIDSLLAATALHYDLSLVTRNVVDFACPGLRVVNPFIDQ